MNRKPFIVALVCAVAIVLGVLVALQQSASPVSLPGGESVQDTLIASITLGVPLNASEAAAPNPHIKQQSSYVANAPIAMRVVSTAAAKAPFTVGARLLDEHGQTHPLAPGQITMAPGESTFCCWYIETPGNYQLQLFRPEKVITVLPLIVTLIPR